MQAESWRMGEGGCTLLRWLVGVRAYSVAGIIDYLLANRLRNMECLVSTFSLFCHICLDSSVYRMLDCVVFVAPAQSGEMSQLNKPRHSINSAVSLYYRTMQIQVPVCGYDIMSFYSRSIGLESG